MTAERFRLVSRWRLEAPSERVYAALADIGALSKWWKGISVTPVHSSTDIVGREARLEINGLALFRLHALVRIESAERNREIRVVSHGDLDGTGTWQLRPTRRGTEATFEWDVRFRHRRLQRLARVLRPLLVLSHAFAMRRGARGLRKMLRAGAH